MRPFVFPGIVVHARAAREGSDMSGWKIIGITDECTECEVCGRAELKSTVLIEMKDGSQLYAGSSCAARKVGTTAANMRGAVKAYRMRLEVARCNFPDYFRNMFGTTVSQHIAAYPHGRAQVEDLYKRYMMVEGFTV